MRFGVVGLATLTLCLMGQTVGISYAGPKYDKKIERAVIAIVSQKLGDMRGSHAINERHSLYPPFEARTFADGTLEPGLQTVNLANR